MTKRYCDICGAPANTQLVIASPNHAINSIPLDICPECLNHFKKLTNTNIVGFVVAHKNELDDWLKELNLKMEESERKCQ